MLSAAAIASLIGFAIWLVKRWLVSSDDKKQSQSVQEELGQKEIREVLAKENHEEDLNALLDSKLRSIDRLQHEQRDNHNS